MSVPDDLQQSIRAGVFSELQLADLAVHQLLTAGFTKDQITVVCSDEAQERFFQQFQERERKNSHAAGEVAKGSVIGGTVGGLAAVAFGLASGFIPLVIAGASGLAAGSAAGGILGAMSSPGVEHEFTQFYHEQLREGNLVVVVEDHSVEHKAKLDQAAAIFAASGNLSVSTTA